MHAKTIIAGVVGLAWFATYMLKSVKPDIELGVAPDALMTTVVGWYFNEKRKEGNAEEE